MKTPPTAGATVRPALVTLSLLSFLQAVLLLIAGHGPTRIIGIVLAIAGLKARLRLLTILAALIVANFGVHLATLTPPFPYRLAHVAILAMYAAMALAGLAVVVARAKLTPALAVAGALAFALIGAEGAIERLGLVVPVPQPTWVGAMQPHATLGDVNPPHTQLRILYPDNPRDYFDENGPSTPFRLAVHDAGDAATLEQPPDQPGLVRVRISRLDAPTPFKIQLSEQPLRVNARESYALSFRARADAPRRIGYGVSMAHAPFQGLGLYRDVAVGLDWQAFSDTFAPTGDDDNAQVHFNLGADATTVEIAHVVLRRTSSGEAVRPPSESGARTQPPLTEYSVTFRFNALGCRGPEFPIPRPSGRRRILVLGAGQTLGVGVHQWDTFAARLEGSLNRGADELSGDRYDVINCGAIGYTVREDRLFYETIGSRYEPDVVLVSLDYGDAQEVRPGHGPATSKLEDLMLTARLFNDVRRGRDASRVEYAQLLENLSMLADACRARHARLAVVVFPTGGLDPERTDLVTAVSSRLHGTDTLFLDLTSAVLSNQVVENLMVHRTDGHPNEIAHQIAAKEIERFLKRAGWIG